MEYPRKNGFILYEGEWIPEGGKQFPWEKHQICGVYLKIKTK